MARRQGHLLKISCVPGRHQDPTTGGICLQSLYDFLKLVVAFAIIVIVHIRVFCTKMAPLEPIHRSEVPFLPFFETNAV
jgi:hypothetical protein